MSNPKKRDNAYYEKRLKLEHPELYAQWKAGKTGSFRKAILMAGLKPARTRLHELKNGWAKADEQERRAFLAWLNLDAPAPKRIASGRYLLPDTTALIRQIMATRGITANQVLKEIGVAENDASLTLALTRNFPLRLLVIEKLEHWLRRQEIIIL